MKKLLFIFLIIPTIALAEEQPKFVPYIIDQDNHAKIMNYLLEQPAKIAIPLIQTLNTLEQKAIKEKDESEKEKKQ